jgi:hypothetical protein
MSWSSTLLRRNQPIIKEKKLVQRWRRPSMPPHYAQRSLATKPALREKALQGVAELACRQSFKMYQRLSTALTARIVHRAPESDRYRRDTACPEPSSCYTGRASAKCGTVMRGVLKPYRDRYPT